MEDVTHSWMKLMSLGFGLTKLKLMTIRNTIVGKSFNSTGYYKGYLCLLYDLSMACIINRKNY